MISEFGSYAQSPATDTLRGAYGSGRYSEPKSSTEISVVRRSPLSPLIPGICGSGSPDSSRICTLRQPLASNWGSEAIRR